MQKEKNTFIFTCWEFKAEVIFLTSYVGEAGSILHDILYAYK